MMMTFSYSVITLYLNGTRWEMVKQNQGIHQVL